MNIPSANKHKDEREMRINLSRVSDRIRRGLAFLMALIIGMSGTWTGGSLTLVKGDVGLTANGTQLTEPYAYTAYYGETVDIRYNGESNHGIAYKGVDDVDDGNWDLGLPTEPGVYHVRWFGVEADELFEILYTIVPDTLSAPLEVSFGDGYTDTVNWNGVTDTVHGNAVSASDIAGYEINVYLDGADTPVHTETVADAASLDISGVITAAGYGSYTASVKAISADTVHYADSASSGISAAYYPEDKTAPAVSSFTMSYDSDTAVFSGTAADSESGIRGYAFSQSDNLGINDSAFTAVENYVCGTEGTFTMPVPSEGLYYFFVKDKDLVTRSENGISVAKITYHDYYSGSAASYEAAREVLVNTTSGFSLPSPSRYGYSFDGWYTDIENAGTKVDSLAANCTDSIEVTAKWTKVDISVEIQADSDHIAMLSGSSIYDGAGSLNAVVTGYDPLAVSYQWYREVDGVFSPITGAESSSLSVKNVADSGSYKVSVTFDASNGGDGTVNSPAVSVSIVKRTLNITPAVSGDAVVCYKDAAPTSFTYEAVGYADGENSVSAGISEGSYNTSYTQGDNAGTYSITAYGFSADNYDFSYLPGSFTVLPKSISNEDTKGVTAAFVQEPGMAADTYTYTGTAVEPAVMVADLGETIDSADIASVVYSNNINADDSATATVTFTRNYSGSLTLSFNIAKADPMGTIVNNAADYSAETGVSFVYDGTSHSENFQTENVPAGATVTLMYRAEGAGKEQATATAPVNAGSYLVYAAVSETANFNAFSTPDLAYVIEKRTVTITSESGEWTYDGNEHTKAGYSISGTFASGESFNSVSVVGKITNVGSTGNTIEYVLSSATNENNYNIVLNEGTLTIVKQGLVSAANQKWSINPGEEGRATWVAVTKENVDIIYELQLYRVDGSAYTTVGSAVSTSATYYNFNKAIHADAEGHGVPDGGYAYTLRTLASGGEHAGNYVLSAESDKTKAKRLYVSEISVAYDPVSTASAYFIDRATDLRSTDPIILIQGEKALVGFTRKYGYESGHFASDSGDCVISFISGGTEEIFEFSASRDKVVPNTYTLTASCFDSSPRIDYYNTNNAANNASIKDEVVIEFRAWDSLGLSYFAISNSSYSLSADRHSLSDAELGKTYTGSNIDTGCRWEYTYKKEGSGDSEKYVVEGKFYVTKPGSYNFFAADESGNESVYSTIEKYYETVNRDGVDVEVERTRIKLLPVSVYKIDFNKGNVSAVNNGYPEHTLKLENQDIILPGITGKLSLSGYVFTNWEGASGLYSDGGKYSANRNDVLMALWSDETYTFGVRYFYQELNADGSAMTDGSGKPVYTEAVAAAAEFTAKYNETIHSGLDKIQKNRTGFVRDDSAELAESFTVTGNGHTLKVYYKRVPYTIIYRYKPVGAADYTTYTTKSYVYGEKVAAMESKPQAPGYTFIGWSYGESGKSPETMPGNDLTATGYFEANTTSYYIDYYTEDLDGTGYSLDHSELRYTFATGETVVIEGETTDVYESVRHNMQLDLSRIVPAEIEGFSYSKTAVSNADSLPVPPAVSAVSATASAIEGQKLHIAYYYTRNSYTITLSVYKGGRSGAPIYTYVFSGAESIPYDTPLDPSVYENKNKELWTSALSAEEIEGFVLAEDFHDWSTGTAPTRMPAADIVVNRDYVATATAPYELIIYYEAVKGQEPVVFQTLTYYGNIGTTQSFGTAASGASLTVEKLTNTYTKLKFYDFTPDYPGSKLSGVITDTTNDAGNKLVLKAYFMLPDVKARVEYTYYDGTDTKTVGYVVKHGPWWTKYQIQENALAEGISSGDFEWSDNGVYYSNHLYLDANGYFCEAASEGAIAFEDFDFSAHQDLLQDVRVTTQHRNQVGDDWSYTVQDMVVDGNSVKASYFGSTSSRENTTDNKSTVYYIRRQGGGVSYVTLNLMYTTQYQLDSTLFGFKQPECLDGFENGQYGEAKAGYAPMSVLFGGEYYDVALCDRGMLYDALGTLKSSYYHEADIAGVSTIETRRFGAVVDTENHKLYITMPEYDPEDTAFPHRLIMGGYFSINTDDLLKYAEVSYNGETKKVLGEYDGALSKYKEVQQQKEEAGLPDADRDTTYRSAAKYGWPSHYSQVLLSKSSYDLISHYKYIDPRRLIYDVSGTTYVKEYSEGEVVKVADESVLPHFTDMPGYDIVWYTDNKYTHEAGETYTISSAPYQYIFGRYEKKVYTGYHNVYYELADRLDIDGVNVNYLTRTQLEALVESDSEHFTVSTKDTKISYETEFKDEDNHPHIKFFPSTIYTYYYNGDVVAIIKSIPEISNSEVMQLDYTNGMYTSGFYGFEYDGTRTNQVRGYIQSEPMDLSAYYKRVAYELTWNYNDPDASGNLQTDEETVEVGYNSYLSAIEPTPARIGYTFSCWKYYSVVGGVTEADPIEPAPERMPDSELKAVAKWTPATFDYKLYHLFQKNDLTYETDLVKAIDKKYTAGTYVISGAAFTLNGNASGTVTVVNENVKNYAVKKLGSGETYLVYAGTYSVGSESFAAEAASLLAVIDTVSADSPNAMTSEVVYECNKYNLINRDEEGAVDASAAYNAVLAGSTDLSMFDYAFTVYRYGGDIKHLHTYDADTHDYKAFFDMELALYYERNSGCSIEIITRAADDPDGNLGLATGLTTIGEGDYSYGQGATLTASVAAGYDFLGWFTAEEYEDHKNDILSATAVSTADSINVPTTGQHRYVAVSNPKAVQSPVVAVKNLKDDYRYGYSASADNFIALSVNMSAIPDKAVYQVTSFQWYEIDSEGNRTAITGANAATYNIPLGLDAGVYEYGCLIGVTRIDNGRSITAYARTNDDDADPGNDPVKIKKAAMSVEPHNYEGIYDGEQHSAYFYFASELNDRKVYFASVPLNATNAAIAGKEAEPEVPGGRYYDMSTAGFAFADVLMKDVFDGGGNVVGREAAPYTVYYYIKDTSEHPNYQDLAGSLTVKITPKTVIIEPTAEAFKKVYDGTADLKDYEIVRFQEFHKFFKILGMVGDDERDYTASLHGSYNDAHKNNANSISVYFTGIENRANAKANENYVIANVSEAMVFTGQIVPRPLRINWLYAEGDSVTGKNNGYFEYVYNGEHQSPYPEIVYVEQTAETEEGVLTADVAYLSVACANRQINTGTYTALGEIDISGSPLGSESADYDFGANSFCAYKILVREVTVQLKDVTYVYDGMLHSSNELTDAVRANIVSPATITFVVNKSYKNVGEYHDLRVVEDTVRIKDNNLVDITGNYRFVYLPSDITITGRPVYVAGSSIKAEDKVYDNTDAAVLDVSGAAFTGIILGDKLALDPAKVSGKFSNINVDDGADRNVNITYGEGALIGASAGNYILVTDGSQATAEAKITPAQIVVTPVNFNSIGGYVYGDALPSAFADTDAAASTHIAYSGWKGDDGAAFAASHSAMVSGTADFNGYMRYQAVGTGKHSISVDVSGISSARNNYTFIAGTPDVFNVAKKPVSITSDSVITKVYDGNTDAAVDSSDLILNGVVNSDEVSIASGYTGHYNSKNAKAIVLGVIAADTVSVTGLSITGAACGNYVLVNDSLDLAGSISKAALTISVNPLTDVPYGVVPMKRNVAGFANTVTAAGFVASESMSDLYGTLRFTSDDFDKNDIAKRSAGKTYNVNAEGLTSGNYDITYVGSTFNVVKTTLYVNAKDFNLAYKQFTAEDLKNGFTSESTGWEYDEDSADYLSLYGPVSDGTYTAASDAAQAAALSKMNESNPSLTQPTNAYYTMYLANQNSSTTATVDSPVDPDGYPVTIDPVVAAILENQFTNYNVVLADAVFSIGHRTLVIDLSKLKITGKIYDGTDVVKPEQIDFAISGTTEDKLKALLKTKNIETGATEDLPDISTVLGGYDEGKSLAENLASIGLVFEGVYSDKNAANSKNTVITATLTENTYMGLRYVFKTTDGDECVSVSTSALKADIIPKPIHIQADDLEMVYGDKFPEAVTGMVFTVGVNGFVDGESYEDLGGELKFNTNYSDSNAATRVNETPVTLEPFGYTSTNYDISYYPGTVTVTQAALSVPKNVVWSAVTPGVITWEAPDAIGDVQVGGYYLELQKNGTTIPVSGGDAYNRLTVTAETLSHNFHNDIMDPTIINPIGIYTVRISAFPSEAGGLNNSANSADIKNVLPSAVVDTSTVIDSKAKLAVTKVTPQFAIDAYTAAGKNEVLIANAPSAILMAGESLDITVSLKEFVSEGVKSWTGYTVSADAFDFTETSGWDVTVPDGYGQDCSDAGKGLFTGVFNLKLGCTDTELEPEVRLIPRPATVDTLINVVPAVNQTLTIGYKFGEGAAPTAYVTASPKNDNITADDYVYSYNWDLKLRETVSVNEHKPALTADEYKFPHMLNGTNTSAGRYKFYCTVTATRKDNGLSITGTRAVSEEVVVEKGNMAVAAYIPGWTYGELRGVPGVTASHPEGKLPKFRYSTENGDSAVWTETMPKDAGSYYIRAEFAASANYNAFTTAAVPFTIAKAKLATPNAIDWQPTASAPYGKMSWTISPVIKENNGTPGDIDATVIPEYTVKLYRINEAGGPDNLLKTYEHQTSAEAAGISALDEILAQGAGKYYFTVQATPDDAKGKSNCFDSDISRSDTLIIHGMPDSSCGTYEKVYDGRYTGEYAAGLTTQGITLTVVSQAAVTYRWYKNGELMPGRTDSYLALFDVDETDTYTCVVTQNEGMADEIKTYYLSADVKILKRPVSFTGKSETVAYDGQTHTVTDILVGGASGAEAGTNSGLAAGDTHNVVFSVTGKNAGTYHGTITTASAITIRNSGAADVTANYIVEAAPGTLIINRSTEYWTIAVSDAAFTYDALPHSNSNVPKAYFENGTEIASDTVFGYCLKPANEAVHDVSALTYTPNSTVLTATNAGAYVLYVKAENSNFTRAAYTTAELNIEKAAATDVISYNPSGTVPTGTREYKYSTAPVSMDDFIVDYSADAVIGADGKGSLVVKWYKTEDGVSTELSSGPSNAGTYFVKVWHTEGTNFLETTPVSKSVIIIKNLSGDPDYKVVTGNFEDYYDGLPHTGTVSIPTGASVHYGISAEQAQGTVPGGTDVLPEYTEIGEYEVYYYVTQPNFVNPLTGSISIKILPHMYSITYSGNLDAADVNISAVPSGQTKTEQQNITLSAVTMTAKDLIDPSIDRYVFNGWNSAADMTGTSYQPEDVYTLDENLDLYGDWDEDIRGTIQFDYNYIDPEDGMSKVTEQRIRSVKAILVRTTASGSETAVDETIVTIGALRPDNKTVPVDFNFGTKPCYVNGEAVTYDIVIARDEASNSDITNYGEERSGYRDRDFVLEYEPVDFVFCWEIEVDDTGFDPADIPSEVSVKVEYFDPESDSWRIITQHANDSVSCVYNPVTGKYTGNYRVWKWNSSANEPYLNNFTIHSVTVSGSVILMADKPELELINCVDEGYDPAYFQPHDPINRPVGDGDVRGGKNDDGVITGVLRIRRYTVAYDTQGGSPSNVTSASFYYNGSVVIDDTVPEKQGYSFKGWNTQPSGSGTFYSAGDTYSENANITLYAIWETKGGGVIILPVIPDTEPELTPEPSEEPEETPEVTPSATAEPTPTEVPEATEAPTATPTATPVPDITPEITEEPEPTAVPTKGPEPTAAPVKPTGKPTPTVSPTRTPEPTAVPTLPVPTGILIIDPEGGEKTVEVIPSRKDQTETETVINADIEITYQEIIDYVKEDNADFDDESGIPVVLRLEVKVLPEEMRTEQEAAVTKILPEDKKLLEFFTMDLFLKVGNGIEQRIVDEESRHLITVDIPDKYFEEYDFDKSHFSMYKVYVDEFGNRITEEISFTTDGKTISWYADTESDYALVVPTENGEVVITVTPTAVPDKSDTHADDDSNDTDDSGLLDGLYGNGAAFILFNFIMLLSIILMTLLVYYRTRRDKEEEELDEKKLKALAEEMQEKIRKKHEEAMDEDDDRRKNGRWRKIFAAIICLINIILYILTFTMGPIVMFNKYSPAFALLFVLAGINFLACKQRKKDEEDKEVKAN